MAFKITADTSNGDPAVVSFTHTADDIDLRVHDGVQRSPAALTESLNRLRANQ